MSRGVIRFGQLLVLIALLTACGGHWLALQSVAWATMVAQYARTTALSDAISKTFDGEHPCKLCKTIENGKKNEEKRDIQVDLGKLNLFHHSPARLVTPPRIPWRMEIAEAFAHSRLDSPLLQPPRGFSA